MESQQCAPVQERWLAPTPACVEAEAEGSELHLRQHHRCVEATVPGTQFGS